MSSAVDLAVARRAFRQVWIGATVWALVFGGTVAASATTYVTSFPDQASRRLLATSTGSDTGLAILLGPVAAIGTVAGYTVYKCYVFLTTIGAIWGLLVATRVLRGEEDTGRWQLVLAGGTRASRATAATLAALGAAVFVVFAGTTALTLVAGRDPDIGFGVGQSVLYGSSIAIAPAVFVAVGALTSQLSPSRRVATGLGMGIFGVAFVVRMIADSASTTRWLLWLTPFGWTERMRPFTENDRWPLVLAFATVSVLVVWSMRLASRRDAGTGALASRDVVAPRPFGLRSPSALTARLELPVLLAWGAGVVAAGFAFGIIGKVATGEVPSSISDTLDNFGVHGDFVRQYFGVAFLLVATLVALLPASQIGAASDEETSGRLVHVLVQPTRRVALLGGRLALCCIAIVASGLLAGLAAWLGAETQGVHPGFGRMVVAGLNVVPTALLVLGIGAVVLAKFPRASTRTVYAVVVGSLIIDLLGSMISSVRWLDHVSLFHYMALAPADQPEAATIVITLSLAAALYAVALLLFERRDVETG